MNQRLKLLVQGVRSSLSANRTRNRLPHLLRRMVGEGYLEFMPHRENRTVYDIIRITKLGEEYLRMHGIDPDEGVFNHVSIPSHWDRARFIWSIDEMHLVTINDKLEALGVLRLRWLNSRETNKRFRPGEIDLAACRYVSFSVSPGAPVYFRHPYHSRETISQRPIVVAGSLHRLNGHWMIDPKFVLRGQGSIWHDASTPSDLNDRIAEIRVALPSAIVKTAPCMFPFLFSSHFYTDVYVICETPADMVFAKMILPVLESFDGHSGPDDKNVPEWSSTS